MSAFRRAPLALVLVAALAGVTATAAEASTITYTGNGKFTGTGGSVTFETVGGTELSCSSDGGSGRLAASPASTGEATVFFKGCKTAGKTCTTSGDESGEISDSGKGKLVKVKTGEVALLIEIEPGHQVKCGTVTITLRGDIIGPVGPIGTKTKSWSDTWRESKGLAEITEFEGKKTIWESSFGEGAFEQTALEGSATLTLEEGEGELNE
jgi:hypothetical protein